MYGKIKMGFCPIGKFVFSHEDAVIQKKKLESRLQNMGIVYYGIDEVLKDGIVRSYDDVAKVVGYFRNKNIDCLFIPHCNFGTESAAGLIARDIGKPVLLWGPRDGAPLEDGTRLRDSLCGMFATSKVLRKLGVNFTYIENCDADDQVFKDGIDLFLRAANVIKSVKNARIGMVGNRIDFFWSTIIDENDLLQRFGIEVLPLDLVKIVRFTKELAASKRKSYLEEIEELSGRIDLSMMGEHRMLNILGLRDALLGFAGDNGLNAIAVESFMSLVEELDACMSMSQALVSERGIPCICESDIHGAVSSIIAEAAALNDSVSFFADLTVRHPSKDNGLLLWHDSFPLSLKAGDSSGKLGTHWILPGFQLGMCHWRLKEGDITIVRFDGEHGQYRLLGKECRSIDGPFTQNTYVWVEMDNYTDFEKRVINGPYIHHTSCIYGKYADVLKEAGRYLGLEFDG